MSRPVWSEVDELGMLGCIVSSGGVTLDQFPVTAEYFFGDSNRQLATVLLEMHASRTKICTETVLSKLGTEQVHMLGLPWIMTACFYPSPAMAVQFYENLSEKLTQRRAQALAAWMQNEAYSTDDVPQFCEEIARRASALSPESGGENLVSDALDEIERNLQQIEKGVKIRGEKTFIGAWNKIFGGICDTQLYAIASRPGMGKTAMLEQLVQGYLANEIPVLVFERDMSVKMLLERIACRIAGVPYWRYARNEINALQISEIRSIIAALRKSPLYVLSPSGMTAEMMCAMTRRAARVSGVKAVFLDHIQTLAMNKGDVRESLTKASLTLRQCVTDTGIPHIILAHLNRDGAKGRPTPEQIKEFDQLYGDSDGMVLLWSDKDRTDLKPGEKLEVNFYACKNRSGPLAEEKLLFDGNIMSFTDAPKE